MQDIDSLLEYIVLLFEEKQYEQAGQLWKKVKYEDLKKSKYVKNIEYLKIVMMLKDELIDGLMYGKNSGSSKVIGEEKINYIVN